MRTFTTLALGVVLALVPTWAHAAQGKTKKTSPPTKSSPSGNAKQQQQNLAKLKSDLQAIHGKNQVTQKQKQAVAQDLYAILSIAHKPSQQSVQTFASDLTKALADGKISTAEAMKLAQDMQAVLASANISQQAAQKLMQDVQALLKATNLTKADAQTIQSDVQAIVTTAQRNGAGTQTKPGK